MSSTKHTTGLLWLNEKNIGFVEEQGHFSDEGMDGLCD